MRVPERLGIVETVGIKRNQLGTFWLVMGGLQISKGLLIMGSKESMGRLRYLEFEWLYLGRDQYVFQWAVVLQFVLLTHLHL